MNMQNSGDEDRTLTLPMTQVGVDLPKVGESSAASKVGVDGDAGTDDNQAITSNVDIDGDHAVTSEFPAVGGASADSDSSSTEPLPASDMVGGADERNKTDESYAFSEVGNVDGFQNAADESCTTDGDAGVDGEGFGDASQAHGDHVNSGRGSQGWQRQEDFGTQQVPLYASAGAPPYGPSYFGRQPRPTIPPKKGPSAATIVLGALIVLVGIATLVAGLSFSAPWVTDLVLSSREVFAIVLAAVGVLLLVVAVVCAVFQMHRNRNTGTSD